MSPQGYPYIITLYTRYTSSCMCCIGELLGISGPTQAFLKTPLAFCPATRII
ncbi:hypothetical protein AC25_4384 [Escherichia coli 1-110-08_S3_C2]|nr:hypothetical protein AC25_4384 [Escherichia coli 1-110-08_S3_C2]